MNHTEIDHALSMPNCSHTDETTFGKVCLHLLSNPELDFFKRFTGAGITYEIICSECAKNLTSPEFQVELVQVCASCFAKIEADGYWNGILGNPQVLKRISDLKFCHRQIDLKEYIQETILDLQPIRSEAGSAWLGLTETGKIIRIETEPFKFSIVCECPLNQDNFVSKAGLRVSPDGDFAAILDVWGSTGVVINTWSGKVTLELNRGLYHVEQTVFPLAFFELNGKVWVVHQTDWNRLDISDPQTGAIVTSRTPTSYKTGEPTPVHYLDYFHGGLSVSPNQEWVVDNGWVWHPVGAVVTWNIKQWLNANVWESEDGASNKTLCWRDYFWDGPICWIDDHTLAVWGYGNDDEWLIPAVRLFDVISGKELSWFAGPVTGIEQIDFWKDGKVYQIPRDSGSMIYDQYLFSFAQEHGISVWDIATGEQLLHDPDFCPMRYHSQAHEFITLLPDGKIQLSRLKEGG
jgi:hypothetical protein